MLFEPVDCVPDDHDASRNHGAGCRGCASRDQQGRTALVAAIAQRGNLDRFKVHVHGRDLAVRIVDGSRLGHVDTGLEREQGDRRKPMNDFEIDHDFFRWSCRCVERPTA